MHVNQPSFPPWPILNPLKTQLLVHLVLESDALKLLGQLSSIVLSHWC
jgi:hypothetical protein